MPLWPCDAARIEEVIAIARREALPCVFFVKYAWPWTTTRHHFDADGRIVGWRRKEVVSIGGQRMAVMPPDYFRYNQVQPAIWRVDYLESLLGEAMRRGIEDPWAFERFCMPGQPHHYVADYRWPSRHCGYRRGGRVYLRALYAMKMPEGKELRDELLDERFPRLSPALRRVLGAAFGLWGRLRNVPARFERERARRPTTSSAIALSRAD